MLLGVRASRSAKAAPALKLAGRGAAAARRAGERRRCSTANGRARSRAPPSAARTTGARRHGDAELRRAGLYRLKAERPTRSAPTRIVLCVDPPGADPVHLGRQGRPSIGVARQATLARRQRTRLASERGRSRTMVVSWQADDGDGAGVAHYAVEVREIGERRPGEPGRAGWRSIADRTATPSAHFRGESGKAYQFRVTAIDRATNRGDGRVEHRRHARRRPRPPAAALLDAAGSARRARRPGARP